MNTFPDKEINVAFVCIIFIGFYPVRSYHKILSIGTDRSGQTLQTQIRLLVKEQSDQALHCLHLLNPLLH